MTPKNSKGNFQGSLMLKGETALTPQTPSAKHQGGEQISGTTEPQNLGWRDLKLISHQAPAMGGTTAKPQIHLAHPRSTACAVHQPAASSCELAKPGTKPSQIAACTFAPPLFTLLHE